LEVALQTISEEIPQKHINKAMANFTKCLTAYLWLPDGHSKHLQQICPSPSLHTHLVTNKLALVRATIKTTGDPIVIIVVI